MEIEIAGEIIEVRDILFGEKREYIKKLKELENRVKESGSVGDAIDGTYDLRIELLCKLSDGKINSELLDKLNAKKVDDILMRLDNMIRTVEEDIKKK